MTSLYIGVGEVSCEDLAAVLGVTAWGYW